MERKKELIEYNLMRAISIIKHSDSAYLNPHIKSFQTETFEGEFELSEIFYIKYMAVKEQRYLKAALLRDIEKKMLGI